MPTALFLRVHHYCLLNASFSDDIGLRSGKTALLLFYGQQGLLPENPLRDHFTYSYLDELTSQISAHTPLEFGSGLAGLGMVLTHLQQQQILEIDINELLEETDQYFLSLVFRGNLSNVSLFSGLAGIGLYLLSRVRERQKTISFREMTFRESVIAILDQLETLLLPVLNAKENHHDTGIFEGLAGVLLFVHAVDEEHWHRPLTGKLKTTIGEYCLTRLIEVPAAAAAAGTWFALLYCTAPDENPALRERVYLGIKAWLEKLDEGTVISAHAELAFQSLWLHLLWQCTGLRRAEYWSGCHLQVLNTRLSENSLPRLFPFNRQKNAIPLGLEDGIIGAVFPLWSIQMRRYEWLEVFGFSRICEFLTSPLSHYHTVMQTEAL